MTKPLLLLAFALLCAPALLAQEENKEAKEPAPAEEKAAPPAEEKAAPADEKPAKADDKAAKPSARHEDKAAAKTGDHPYPYVDVAVDFLRAYAHTNRKGEQA